MKKMLTVVLLTVLILGVVFTLSGCARKEQEYRDYITRFMDSMPIEVSGYELVKWEEGDGDSVRRDYDTHLITVETSNGPEEVEVTYKDHNYVINTNKQTTVIDDEYMLQNVAYSMMISMWNIRDEDARIRKISHYVYVFDNQIFIITLGVLTRSSLGTTWKNAIPLALFLFDVTTSRSFYCGYLKDLWVHQRDAIKIIKTQ